MTPYSKFSAAFLILTCQAAWAAPQKTFDTPEAAAQALLDAASTYNVPALLEILGPDARDLIATEDPVQDKNRALTVYKMAQEKHLVRIDPKNAARAELSLGNNDWPLPIPLV